MSSYDTSPSGLNAAGRQDDTVIRDAKAGAPKGVSGAYNDVPNTASPNEGTIARNFVNSHRNPSGPAGSTADTGRKRP